MPDCKCRYLCERCGGNGKQEDGAWDAGTKSFTGKAGTCQICRGEGYLGYIEYRTIDRASLPPLPSEWQPPFAWANPTRHTDETIECLCDANRKCMVFDCGSQTGQFLAALLNACYPVGGK